MANPPSVIVVAVTDDTRMRSQRPTPLHPVGGRPIVHHVIEAVAGIGPRRVLAVVDRVDGEVAKELADRGIDTVAPARPVAADPSFSVLAALAVWNEADLDEALDPDRDDVLVVPADLPLLRAETLARLVAHHRADGGAATVLAPDDATVSSVWIVRRSLLGPALRRTAAPGLAAVGDVLEETGHRVARSVVDDELEIRPVADRGGLAAAEAEMRRRVNDHWMRQGVTLTDPDHTHLDVTITLAPDVVLAPGVVLEGATRVGEGTVIGPGCHLVDTVVGAGCRLDGVTAELATIGDQCRVGPLAVLGPGATIAPATVTGPLYTASADGP